MAIPKIWKLLLGVVIGVLVCSIENTKCCNKNVGYLEGRLVGTRILHEAEMHYTADYMDLCLCLEFGPGGN